MLKYHTRWLSKGTGTKEGEKIKTEAEIIKGAIKMVIMPGGVTDLAKRICADITMIIVEIDRMVKT